MSVRKRLLALLALVAVLGAATAAARAVAPEIRDLGKFFSAEAVKKADADIREIARKHGLDLLIETYATVAADQVEKVKALEGKARAEFFDRWAKERAQERVVNGVYVLICREPRFLQVEVEGRGRKVLTPAFRSKLYEAIRAEFAQGRFDEGLQAAVRLLEEQLGKSSAK
jgi:uncharacterized membrane protein YgcG